MLTPGTILQTRYNVVRQLGQGGMGTVYEAIDQRLDTLVALKETGFVEERLRKQFEREARLLARLHHPALPRVSDHFSEGDGQFLVMQFIPGDDLSEMMASRQGPFPAEQVLTWLDQLLDALDYLHTQEPQIVHRDIKPQNLKLTARGQIILLDFGLAKGQPGEISRVTTSASIFGYTPNYAPLEQIQGLGTDPRSDLYSLSATIYHLLTGTKPPDALTRAAALVNGQPDPLARASELNPNVGTEISDVLQRAMAQNREQRFASASEMRKALHRTEQTATVMNRSEAQTVLRPPVARKVSPETTNLIDQQPTAISGETTVVRPILSASRRKMPTWVLSSAALVLVAACALGFYWIRKRDNRVVEQPPTPTPAASVEPSQAMDAGQGQGPNLDTKQESADKSATPETKTAKKADRKRSTTQAASSAEPGSSAHESENPDQPSDFPSTPQPPRPGRNRLNPRGVPTTQTLPGGVIIRRFPDGSQIISSPDGTRVFIDPGGRREVVQPGEKSTRRKPAAP